MIEKILVAVEDNEERMLPVAAHAAEITAALDAEVVLLHVYEEGEFEEYLDRLGYDSADPDDIAKRNDVVEACTSPFVERGVRPKIAGAVGDPATEIANYVEQGSVDHVVLGGRSRSPTGKALLGSVSQSVLRSVEVPCTISMS